ncbi:MAG TPA: GAF domain-containing sensor histidine kinase [Clostridia bacterium]|nr:GAF domain-containing sensor histidine kinase [Clostridia bacterium]
MLSAHLLPIKETARGPILDAVAALHPHQGEINSAWRQRIFQEFDFEGRAMVALERLNLGVGFTIFSQSDFQAFLENVQYYGARLAKLNVDTRAVARSMEIYLELCEPYIESTFAERRFEIMAALESLASISFITVSGAYFDTQKNASDALLQALDAELSARDTSALLERVLEITTRIFRATVGLVLLLDPETRKLHVQASVGFSEGLPNDVNIALGQGFSGEIAETGEAAILPDLAQSHGVLNPALRGYAKALWGMPLKVNEQVIGVLIIGFEKPYTWLPTEKDLFRALADRSALAIDRARMTDALREREARIVELSGHLLKAQEDERKRISRELHDETGQALMVIRLYLGMLESSVTSRTAKGKIQELFEVVDRTIDGIRRIIARLSPLVLQELGLVAAIRKEAKDLARTAGVHARVAISDDIGRLAPEVEAAIYRVVQESLHNVAKHAQAKSVNIQMSREDGILTLTVEDDGVGISATASPSRRSFGLAGMRERVSTLGGTLKLSSRKGQGTRITVAVPAPIRDSAQEADAARPISPGPSRVVTPPSLAETGTTD